MIMLPPDNTISVVGIVYQNSVDYIRKVFEAYKRGDIVVPLKNRAATKDKPNLVFTHILEPVGGGGWVTLPHQISLDDSLAQISYTSGTEGEPKGIMLSHRNLGDTIRRLNHVMQLDGRVREYVGVPVFHSFGFGRIRACCAVGGAAYIPQHGFNPVEIANLLRSGEINAISAVPTLWRLILKDPRSIGNLGSRVKWIEIGSQFMATDEKELMKSLFPNARIIQHYGLTEASRTTFLDISSTEGPALESVGQATDGVEIRLSPDDLIEIRGAHVATQKLTSAGISPLCSDGGWFVTTDKGRIDNGYLYFLGRADDVINCGGTKLSPDLLERMLLDQLGVAKGIAISKVPDHIRGNGILVTIEAQLSVHQDAIRASAIEALASMNVRAGEALHFDTLDTLPVTDTGKLRRAAIGEAYVARHPHLGEDKPRELIDNYNGSLVEVFEYKYGIGPIRPTDSLIGLGVDSLFLVEASVEIERYLGFLPDNWMGLNFEQLERLTEKATAKAAITSGRKPLVFIGCFLLFLLAGEVFLQVRSYLKTGRSAFDLLVNQSVKVFDSKLGVTTYRPNFTLLDRETKQVTMQINHLGLRSPEISPHPQQDEVRLAIVGASTVAGAYASSNDEAFSQILAKKLRTAGHHANVINGGIEGLGLDELVIVTEKLIVPQRPSKIFVYTGFNDIAGICNSQRASPQQPWRPPTFQLPHWVMSQEMIRKNTTFLRSLPLRSGNIVDPRSVDFSTWKQQLESIASSIRDANIEPVFITNARAYVNVTSEKQAELAASSLFYYSCLDLAGIIEVGEIYNQLIRDLAVKYDAKLIDLAAMMPGGRTYFVDGGHFTPKGEEFAADAIFDAIKDGL